MCEKEITRIHVPNLPAWYNHKTSHGLLMSQIGVLQGTYLGIYVGDCCHFWSESPSQACKFCATGLNVGHYEAATKTIEDVVETALAAKSESRITFVHLNSGYQGGNDLMQMLPYVQALKKHVGILIGLQTIPSANLSEYDRLISAGVDHFSFCYELHSTSSFNEYLPGKAKHIGQKRFWDALEYVAKKMPRGSVSGEIIAGIEPLESTIEAIHYIATHGAFPTVCIFRPLMKTPLENMESPAEEDMCRVLEHVAHACMNNNIPIGLAPNLEVSIVMTPDDCQYLLPQNFRWRIHYYKNHLLKIMAKPIFAWKMRKHG